MALKGALENELFRHVDGGCGRCCRDCSVVGSEYQDQNSGCGRWTLARSLSGALPAPIMQSEEH